jgi:aspartyl-tRNA(Asn)/glutamyl-tRNA(Gln) amidotransferase subunit A
MAIDSTSPPTIRESARLIARGKLSPLDLVNDSLAHIDADNVRLGAFITVTADSARAAATKAGLRVRAGRGGVLTGIPISVKDLIVTIDAPTSLGSRVIPGGLPAGPDGPAINRLRRAGAVILGKTNLHEVALGVTSDNEHFGAARNPWDPTRVAGGSSGGSAVAVAAGMGLGSVGTDTRGSIRIPSACCGVVGLKPTYGTIPTDGVFPLAATLDHIGPMARSVEDVALLFGVMTGSARRAKAVLAAVDRKPGRKKKIAVCEYFIRDADHEIATAIETAIKLLARRGAALVSVEIPELEPALEASRVIVLAEAIAYHDDLLRRNPDGYGPNLKSRLLGGYQLSALQYVQAEERRLELLAAYATLFQEVDCLIGAVLPVAPPKIGTQSVPMAGVDTPLSEAFCRYNAPQNMTGVPALALPCGFSKAGLPIAMQLVAGSGQEEVILGIGATYQRETDWHTRKPAAL